MKDGTETTPNYSYFHQKLLNWIVERMNNQQDAGPAEDIAAHLANASHPGQAAGIFW